MQSIFFDSDAVLGYPSPILFFQTPELLLHVFPCHLTFILFSFKGVDIKTCTYITNSIQTLRRQQELTQQY